MDTKAAAIAQTATYTTEQAAETAQQKEENERGLNIIRSKLSTALSEISVDKREIEVTHIKEVEGAFILRKFLTPEEVGILQICAENLVAADPTRDEGRALSRRQSAHHTPCIVNAEVMRPLCNRIREYLPIHAGPAHLATLEEPGLELSNFLRCYSYSPMGYSGLHFDKSLTEHDKHMRMLKLTAYSVLFYLRGKPDCEGGRTLFYPHHTLPSTRSGKGVVIDPDDPRANLGEGFGVDPHAGDVLIFPHGRHLGCYPDPLHEGEIVESGRKTLIRTDLCYLNPVKPLKNKNKGARTPKGTQPNQKKRAREEIDALQEQEQEIKSSLDV